MQRSSTSGSSPRTTSPRPTREDLRLLFQEEPESDSDDDFSWDGADSSSEEEIGSFSSGDDPTTGNAF